MIEIPLVGLIFMLAIFTFVGVLIGRNVELATRGSRRQRALSRVTPAWEVHVGSSGRDYGHDSGEHMVVSVRKVRRSGSHFEQLQKIEVTRVRGDADPEKILAAVDRAQAMVQALALTGVA